MFFPILMWGIFFLALANCWNDTGPTLFGQNSRANRRARGVCEQCGKPKKGGPQ